MRRRRSGLARLATTGRAKNGDFEELEDLEWPWLNRPGAPRTPEGYDRGGHKGRDRASNARIEKRALDRKPLPGDVYGGVEQSCSEYALTGVVVEPDDENAQRHRPKRPPGDPYQRAASLQQGHVVENGPSESHHNAGRNRTPPFLHRVDYVS